jgi:hypothetical protein
MQVRSTELDEWAGIDLRAMSNTNVNARLEVSAQKVM